MSQGNQFTKVQYGPEASAYGTEALAYNELAKVQSVELPSANNFIYDRGLGEGLNVTNTYYGPFDGSGKVSFSVVDFDFLKHWVGNKSGAGTSGDHYILTEATSVAASASGAGILQPFSFEILNDLEATDSVDYGLGCVGTSFSLSGSMGSKLNCDANFICKETRFRESGATYVPVTTTPFVMINGTWKWGSTPSTISGVRSFNINYDNGLIVDTRSIESRFLNIPVLGLRSYTGSVEIIMSQSLASTIIADYYGKSAGTVRQPEDGSTSITPTANLEFKIEFISGAQSATIWLDQCSIDDISKPFSLGGGLVILTFNFTAKSGRGNVPIEWWAT